MGNDLAIGMVERLSFFFERLSLLVSDLNGIECDLFGHQVGELLLFSHNISVGGVEANIDGVVN